MRFCRTESGEVLIDHFIRFEHLAEDFKPVASRLGVSAVMPWVGRRDREMTIRMREALLRSKRPGLAPMIAAADYREMYKTQESIDIVAGLDSETITRFGYRFGG